MASPAVTLCPRSYYGRGAASPNWPIPTGGPTPKACDNPVASCPVRDVEHEPHDWLHEDAPWIEPRYSWRHCNGVSLRGGGGR